MVIRRIASAWIALAAAGASDTACNAILGNQVHELAGSATRDGSAAPDGPGDTFDGPAEGEAPGASLDANASPEAADEMDGLSGSSDGAFDSGASDESAVDDGGFDSGAVDESAADAVDSQASPQDAPDEQSVDASDATVDDASPEASDGAPDAMLDAATCANDIGSLSNIGTQNFHISFRIVTTQAGWVALVNQRSGCGFGSLWDVRQCAPGRVACPADGALIVETANNNDGASYQLSFSQGTVNDGKPHDVVVARTARTITIQIDGNAPSNATPSVASFGAMLPPVKVGKDVCIGVDSTVALTGTLSNLCIASP